MSLYQCQTCGCVENTAVGDYWLAKVKRCSECAFGKWHGRFPKQSAEGWYYDASGHIYSPGEVDEKTMEWKYNRSFKMIGKCKAILPPTSPGSSPPDTGAPPTSTA